MMLNAVAEVMLFIQCTLKKDHCPEGASHLRAMDSVVTSEKIRFLTVSGSVGRVVC